MAIESTLQTRRELLRTSAVCFGHLALSALLAGESRAEPSPSVAARDPLAAKPTHFPARAKRIIFLFMKGGPSHVDTFDPKPLLDRDHGKPYPGEKPRVQFAKTNALLRSPWKFQKHGESGIEVSDLFPHIAKCVDDLCLI